ncbi:MAG: ABC transporter substrate-binding protein [Bacteroidia bacterium]|nr:ABC transporter substrate-binding protein [Bacteroidia bacterium]
MGVSSNKLNSRNYQLMVLLLLSLVTGLFLVSGCKPRQIVVAPTPKPAEPVKPPVVEEVKEPVKEEKISWNIVLMMPFSLEKNFAEPEISEDQQEPIIELSSLPALHCYEAALLAADSLKKLNRDVKIVAMESPEDSLSLARTMISKQVKESDFIFATLPNTLSNAAAQLAQKNNVNLILTQAGTPAVLDNAPNSVIANASTTTQIKEMVKYMLSTYTNANIILVFRNTKREDEMAAVFRQEVLKSKGTSDFRDLNATEKPYKDIVNLLSKTKRNLVFIVSSDEAFVNPMLSLIEAQDIFGVYVSGLPTWQNFESINFMGFKNTQVFLFDYNFIDYDAPAVKLFRQKFISTYHNDPLPVSYTVFDIILGVGKKDKKSNQKLKFSELNTTLPNYHFTETGSGSGYENSSISVLQFNDYKLEKINSGK